MVFTVYGRVGLVDDGRMLRQRRDADNIRRMAASRAFGVISVDRAARDRGDGVLHEAGFVDGIGMNRHLHVEIVGHPQAGVDGGGRGAPVLMQLQSARSGAHLFRERLGRAGVALAEKAEVHWPRVGRFQHPRQIPCARSAGGGGGSR